MVGSHCLEPPSLIRQKRHFEVVVQCLGDTTPEKELHVAAKDTVSPAEAGQAAFALVMLIALFSL